MGRLGASPSVCYPLTGSKPWSTTGRPGYVHICNVLVPILAILSWLGLCTDCTDRVRLKFHQVHVGSVLLQIMSSWAG